MLGLISLGVAAAALFLLWPMGRDAGTALPPTQGSSPSGVGVPPAPVVRAPVSLDQARSLLEAGQAALALPLLQQLLAQDPGALTRARLGAGHTAWLNALADAARTAVSQGDEDTAQGLRTVMLAALRDEPGAGALVAALMGDVPAGAAPPQATAGSAGGPAAGATGRGWMLRMQPGDSLSALSARLLNSGHRWPTLWQAHQGQAALGRAQPLPDPHRLAVGQLLWVPLVQRDGEAGLAWRVAPGDNLSRIAGRLWGDPARWPELARANRLADPHRLRPGQVLWVPAAP
jgi:hypothetical protein